MSLLLAEGHPDAGLYPVGMLQDEAEIVIERANMAQAGTAIMHQMAASTIPTAGMSKTSLTKAHKGFQKMISTLMGGSDGQ